MPSMLRRVAFQNLADGLHQPVLRHRKLGLGLLLEVLVAALLELGELGAEKEILDLHLAPLLLVRALDDDARGVALVGIFHLRAELARAEIELCADAGAA